MHECAKFEKAMHSIADIFGIYQIKSKMYMLFWLTEHICRYFRYFESAQQKQM